jgi:hypothetical protein
MKLLIIFDKNIEISPEKVCIHTGHTNREIMFDILSDNNHKTYNLWQENDCKTVLLRDKISNKLLDFIKTYPYYNYTIIDAGLDGVFEKGTILGYAILVPKDDETFKRLRTLKF